MNDQMKIQMKFVSPLSLNIAITISLSPSLAFANSNFTEENLIRSFYESGTAAIQNQIDDLSAQEVLGLSQKPFQTNLALSGHILGSNKDASNAMQPALEKSFTSSIELRKNIPWGIQTRVGFEESYSRLGFNPTPITTHTPYFFAELTMSLLQNPFGSLDQARLMQGTDQNKLILLQRNLALHQSLNGVRALYWSAIANRLSIINSEGLLNTTKQQLNEIIKRQRSGVAEKSDVLLSQAQVAQRESSLMVLRIKEQNIFKNIKMVIPNFQAPTSSNYPLVDMDKILSDISQCMEIIQTTNREGAFNNSTYSEIIPLIESQSSTEKIISAQGFGPELSVALRAENNGVDTQFSEAFKESAQLDKNTWSAGVMLQIPLDSADKNLKSIRARKVEASAKLKRLEITSLLNSTHENAAQNLTLLIQTIQNLNSTTQLLKERIQSIEKKYVQGRVDLLSLVQEQDQLFNAENGLIESRLMFMNEFLNYFSAFDRFPCAFNLQPKETTL